MPETKTTLQRKKLGFHINMKYKNCKNHVKKLQHFGAKKGARKLRLECKVDFWCFDVLKKH